MRNITTDQGVKVVVKRSSSGGLGLFSGEPIKKGTVIIEYVGPILTNKEAEEKCGRYLFQINSRKTIYGSGRDNIARYANHSCNGNCEIEIKKGRVYIVARKNIKANEELGYDYGKEYFDYFIKPHGCLCDSCVKKREKKLKNESTTS